MSRPSSWQTAENIAILKQMWLANESVVSIATTIGTTRGAIVGKARRLGLPEHANADHRLLRWSPNSKWVDRVFGLLAELAVSKQTLPSNFGLREKLGIRSQTLGQCFRQLIADRRINVERNQGAHYRKITILTGDHAGKTTETAQRAPKPAAAKPAAAAVVAPAGQEAPRPCCQWCEHEFTRARGRETYCSRSCADAARSYGPLVTKRQIEARRAHVASQPRGCATVEELLQRGGSIYTEPAPRWAGAGA